MKKCWGHTHLFVGIAAAAVIAQPKNVGECAVVVIGGSLGAIICDIEVKSNKYFKDVYYSRITFGAMAILALLFDFLMGGVVCSYILTNNWLYTLIGAVTFVTVCLFGYFSIHRTFTHSILYVFLLGAAVGLLCKPLVLSFLVGAVMHLVLDIVNKKPILLLYPVSKGVCLKWFTADGVADKVFLALGIVGSIIALYYST